MELENMVNYQKDEESAPKKGKKPTSQEEANTNLNEANLELTRTLAAAGDKDAIALLKQLGYSA